MTVKVPPLKCQGIKTKLAEWIKDHSTYENNGTWIEPFMGSGVVGFNIAPRRAIFADVNPHIINFYNAIKDGIRSRTTQAPSKNLVTENTIITMAVATAPSPFMNILIFHFGSKCRGIPCL